MSEDSPTWVSERLFEAALLIPNKDDPELAQLMFALADRASAIEQLGISPVRESNWGTVFCHASVLASGIVVKSRGEEY